MSAHIIVYGHDELATQITREFNDAGLEVVPLHSPADLREAGVGSAAAVVAASGNDAVNLEVALLARRANPRARVVTRIANPVLNKSMKAKHGPGAVLDVADLAAPSVVEALLERTVHHIDVGDEDFAVSGAPAPRDGTLRQIYGRLAPVAVIRGDRSPNPGEVIICPPLDLPVRQGDFTSMIGRAEDLAEQGLQAPRGSSTRQGTRSPVGRVIDSVRAFNDDLNPTFFRALAVLGALLVGSTFVLHFGHRDPAMSWMDAIYFSTETLATVGFGDFNFMHEPLWLRLWGLLMMLGGVATIAVVVAFIADVLVSRRLAQAASRQTVRHLSGHYVVVGLGSFGIRVASMLKQAGCSVVVIERNDANRYLAQAAELKIPVLLGDATLRNTLDAARVERARAVAVLTEDDMVNVETAFVLEEIIGEGEQREGRRIPVVLRIYDPDLGDAVGHRLDFSQVLSTVDLATPWFVGAAMGLEVLGTFSVGRNSFMVGGVRVAPGSRLDGIRMADVSTRARVIALNRTGSAMELHPSLDATLQADDVAYVVGPHHELLATLRCGQPGTAEDPV